MSKRSGLLAVLVLAIFALLVSCTAWWLDRNELPDGFQNEYEHSYTLGEIYFRLRDSGWSEAQGALWSGYYPPLPHAVAATGLSLFGRSHRVAVLSLSVFLLLLLGSAAALGRRLGGAGAGAFAVTLLAAYPSVFGNARRYEPNIALSGMVGLALTFLTLRGLRSRGAALVFGGICGLGMLTDRVSFALYLLPPVLVLLLASPRPGPEQRRRWLLAGAVTLGVCGWFYAHFLRLHVWEVWTQLGGEVTARGADRRAFPPWTWRGLLYYPLSFVDSQMGLVPAALTAIGLITWGARARGLAEPVPRRLLESTAFGGLAVLTLLGKKQPFYSVPLLMPLAVLAGAGWRSLRPPWLRAALVAVLVVGGAQQLTFLTRGQGLLPTPGRWGWLAGVSPLPPGLLGYEYTQAWAPREQQIDLARAAALCAAQRTPERPHVVLFSDAHAVYEGQLLPAARLALDSLLVDAVTMLPEAVADQQGLASCFLYVTDTDLLWPTGASVQALWDRRGLGPVPPSTLEALSELEARSHLLAAWPGVPEGRVRVFAIDPPGGG